jgi:hypothetical protein
MPKEPVVPFHTVEFQYLLRETKAIHENHCDYIPLRTKRKPATADYEAT